MQTNDENKKNLKMLRTRTKEKEKKQETNRT